jgi:hypothetical protein
MTHLNPPPALAMPQTQPEPSAAEPDHDAIEATAEDNLQDARFLKLAPEVLCELRKLDAGGNYSAPQPSERVIFARDMAQVAILERLARLAQRDLVVS